MKNYMAKMAALDIYLSNTSNEQYEDLKPQIKKQTLQAMPLLSWDFFMNDFLIFPTEIHFWKWNRQPRVRDS